MYIVGLTGGIGAGKSSLSAFFSQKGVPVYNSDLSAKALMEQVDSLKKDIMKTFGKQAYQAGRLDTRYLSQKVFKDSFALKRLNALVHPWVLSDFKSWMCSHQTPYCIKESAILFESGAYATCDLIITVIAPLDERVKRIMQRDRIDRAQILERIRNQWTGQEKVSRSDIVVENIKDIEALKEVVEKTNEQILEMLRRKALLL